MFHRRFNPLGRTTSTNGLCTIDCGEFEYLREDCKRNPCLGLGDVCRTAANITLDGTDDTCQEWCCPKSWPKIVACLIGVALLLGCLILVCCMCIRRKRRCRQQQQVIVHQPREHYAVNAVAIPAQSVIFVEQGTPVPARPGYSSEASTPMGTPMGPYQTSDTAYPNSSMDCSSGQENGKELSMNKV